MIDFESYEWDSFITTLIVVIHTAAFLAVYTLWLAPLLHRCDQVCRDRGAFVVEARSSDVCLCAAGVVAVPK